MKTCPDCNGDGVIEKGTDDEKQCPTCGGSGFVPDDNDDKNNEEIIRTSWERATGPEPRMSHDVSRSRPTFTTKGWSPGTCWRLRRRLRESPV
jgi:RecJ-like exonuclease